LKRSEGIKRGFVSRGCCFCHRHVTVAHYMFVACCVVHVHTFHVYPGTCTAYTVLLTTCGHTCMYVHTYMYMLLTRMCTHIIYYIYYILQTYILRRCTYIHTYIIHHTGRYIIHHTTYIHTYMTYTYMCDVWPHVCCM